MTKKENVRESLKMLRLGYAISFDWEYEDYKIKHFAKLDFERNNIHITGVCTGYWACGNTYRDWYGQFGKSKSFEVLPKDFYTYGL